MATPHIESRKEDIAPIVLMPGDPLRAKYIAEHFLERVKQVNGVRNILGYTGYYHDERVTVFASGMGMPSIGIYAYELFQFYGVETIVRIGSVGVYQKELSLFDLILVEHSVTDSNFATSFALENCHEVAMSEMLNQKFILQAKELGLSLQVGNIYSSDAFYHFKDVTSPLIEEYHCLGVEMESFALGYLAKKLKKQATTLLTVSDSLVTGAKTTSEEREKAFLEMISLALETVTNKN